MAQVTTFVELQAALSARDSDIRVAANIAVASQLSIGYAVTIASAEGATKPYILSKSADFSGNMFRISGGELTLKNVVLDGKQAGRYTDNINNRSLIMVAGGALRLQSGSLLQNNSSYQEGGGVYLSGSESYTNSLIMSDDARIAGCESRVSGGGLMVALRNSDDSVALTNQAVIEGNTARDGGGVYVRSYVGIAGGSLAVGDDVRISDNSASAAGGGIYMSGFRGGDGASVSLTLSNNVSVTNNVAVHGGGVYFYGANTGDTVTVLDSANISQNTATGNGGGLNLNFPQKAMASLHMDGGSVKSNSAKVGGGIYMLTEAGGTVFLKGASVSLNRSSGSGGGLWMQNNSAEVTAAVLQDMIISENKAASQGGGAAMNAGPGPYILNIAGGSISLNAAGANGGGLLIGSAGGSDIAISGCSLAGNEAAGSGGALYFANTLSYKSTISLSQTAVNGNRAGYSGGGLSLTSGNGTLRTTVSDCTIFSNTAQANSGGGIWSGGSKDELTIKGNTSIASNSAETKNGGGIYFNSDSGTLTLTDNTRIIDNRADLVPSDTGNHGGGISVVPGRVLISGNTEISGNSARKHGGGLSASEDSDIRMVSGSIHNNRAAMYGGGIYNHAGSELSVSGGELYANSASVGGAIYNDSVAVVNGEGQIGLTALNTAAQAPGIYNSGTFYTEGERNLNNGLYIESRGSVARLTGRLSNESSIQLNSSDYVSPNLEGRPIVVAEGTMGYPFVTEADAAAFKKPAQGFDGWSVHLSSDRTQVLLSPVAYTITYENTDGAYNPNPTSYTSVTPDIRLSDLGPVSGRRFAGWFDAQVGGNRVRAIPQGSSGNITLYARWEETPMHRLRYHGNDDSNSPALHIPEPMTVEDGGSVTISQNIPVRLGHCFVGWNTEADGEGYPYQPGDTIDNISDDIDLHAQWEGCIICDCQCCCPCPPCPPCEEN